MLWDCRVRMILAALLLLYGTSTVYGIVYHTFYENTYNCVILRHLVGRTSCGTRGERPSTNFVKRTATTERLH